MFSAHQLRIKLFVAIQHDSIGAPRRLHVMMYLYSGQIVASLEAHRRKNPGQREARASAPRSGAALLLQR